MACPLGPLSTFASSQIVTGLAFSAWVRFRFQVCRLVFHRHTNQYHSVTSVLCILFTPSCVTFIMNKHFIGTIDSLGPTYYGRSGFLKVRRVAVEGCGSEILDWISDAMVWVRCKLHSLAKTRNGRCMSRMTAQYSARQVGEQWWITCHWYVPLRS